jgi:hypothetical protein
MRVPCGIGPFVRSSPVWLLCLFLSSALPVQATETSCGQVTIDKQISCEEGVWVDVGGVAANEDGTHGCLGFNAHPGSAAVAVKSRYIVTNTGTVPLYDCVVTESNPLVCGTMEAGDLAPAATWSFDDVDQTCTEALDDHEPDTAVVICYCAAEHTEADPKATASDSADFDCQTPGLGVSKICRPLEGGGADVIISVVNTGDADLHDCTLVEELFEDDPTCPADFGLATPVTPSLTSITDLPVGSLPVAVTASLTGLETDACNRATVTCTVGETESTVSVMADDVCEAMLIEGCLTRSPGFWGTHPDVTAQFLPVDVCGATLSVTDPNVAGSATEDLCFSGRDFKAAGTSPQQLQLIRQCAAAALNVAATSSVGGSCEAIFPGINDTLERCCGGQDPMCNTAATGQEIGASECIALLDAFNNSSDSLEPFEPFVSPGPASPSECKRANGNAFVNPGRTLGPPSASAQGTSKQKFTIRGKTSRRHGR